MNRALEGRSIGACRCQADAIKHKTKRLRSRKERSQMRSGKVAYKVKSNQCHSQGSLDVGHLHGYCRRTRRGDGVPPPLCEGPTPAQEASIITEARLLGHRGLFKREVKSIDIKRLIQGKESKAKTEASHVVSDASGPDEAQEGCEKENQASDATPEQREEERPSGESSPCTPEAKSRKADPHQRAPPSSAEARRLPSPVLETRADTREGANQKSVGAVAQRLRDALSFPLMRKRDLLAESREVLLRALREAHGQRLQQNLLHMHSGAGLQEPQFRKEIYKPKATRKHWERLLMPDTFPAPFQVRSPDSFIFGSKDALVLQNAREERKRLSWDLSTPLQQHFGLTNSWPSSPMDTSVGFLQDVFGPRVSPEFTMGFGTASSSSAAIHGPFAPNPTWRAEPPSHDFVDSDPFTECFAPGRSSLSQASFLRFSPRQELTSQFSLENFPQEQDSLFESQQYSFAPSFSSQPLTSLYDHLYQPVYNLDNPPSLFTSFHTRKLY